MEKVTKQFGDWTITYLRRSGEHRLCVERDGEKSEGPFVPLNLVASFIGKDGRGWVGQSVVHELPPLFEIRAPDGEELDLVLELPDGNGDGATNGAAASH